MSTPALFDVEPVPVKGQPWPWPLPEGWETLSHPKCLAISARWNYCHREPGHDGSHSEHNSRGVVSAVWQSGGSERA